MNATATSRLRLAQAFLRDVRSPEWGIAGQGFRFAASGVLVATVYASVTTVGHDVVHLPFQIALIIGFAIGVCLHFTLQRLFVWRHHERFALAAHHQAARYLSLCATQYGITALTTSQLPGVLGLPVEAVYLMTMVSAAGLNFVVFRGRVFHPSTGEEPQGVSGQAGAQPSRDARPPAQPSRDAMSSAQPSRDAMS